MTLSTIRISWGSLGIAFVAFSFLSWGVRWGAEWYLHRNGFFDALFENRSLGQTWRALGRARECGEPEIERVAAYWQASIAFTTFVALSLLVLFAIAL